MAIYTDNPTQDGVLLPAELVGTFAPVPKRGGPGTALLHAIYEGATSLHRAPVDVTAWRSILVRDHAPGSQYDTLVQLVRAGAQVPDSVACVARTGSGMHGFRGRPWSAQPGNIHLAAHFAPARAIERFESAFTVLAAVSAAEAVETVPGLAGRARIKWVNDVLIDGCKVGGVLAYTQTRDTVVTSVVLGVGLNVEVTPPVERSPVVPAAGCVRDFAPAADAAGLGHVLSALLDILQRNYALLLDDGPAPLLDAYRARSSVLGETVTIMSDDVAAAGVVATGRVVAIGDGLELYLEGRAAPVTRGRLVLGTAADDALR
jgi:BirA family transcriptional regulator, biotin operon repressor / biotin---[acetyl-CoA-carboxylase] ligase